MKSLVFPDLTPRLADETHPRAPRGRVATALLAALTLVASTGCPGEQQSAQARSPGASARPLVATRSLELEPYDRTLPRKLGTLEAAERRELAFEVSGRLVQVVEEGTLVTADQVIAELDSTVERAEQRRAALMLDEARSEERRAQGLAKSRAASAKDLEAAEILREMRATELAMADARLQRRQLHAGIAGVVADVQAEPGELVGPQTPIATVLNTEWLELTIGVPGYQVAQIAPNEPARVYVPAVDPNPIEGTIQRIASAALPGQHLFEVEIRIPNPGSPTGPELRPGMNAWAELVVESYPAALVVPLDAMVEYQGRRVVFFVVEGHALAVPIDTAPLNAETLILPASLPYRQLVVRGHHQLTDGVEVRIDNTVLESGPPT